MVAKATPAAQAETATATRMTTLPGSTVWERLGASAGLWATLWLLVQVAILRTTTADLTATDAAYATALLDERMKWELVTLFRLLTALLILWFMGSLMGRMRLVEGEPGRLAVIAFGVGAVWAVIWLFSALFNSLAILFAADYGNEAGARMAGTLAVETLHVLSPATVFTLLLAVSFVSWRHGGFPKAYTYGVALLTAVYLVLAVVDWYGGFDLSFTMLTLAVAWLAVTSAVLIPAYRPPDYVTGNR